MRRWVLGLVLVGVVVGLFLLGRGDGDDPSSADGTPTPSASSSAPAPVASDDEFCAGYRALADAQGAYVADPDGQAGQLRTAAQALVDTGVPESMSALARTGYYVEISGVFESIGDELPLDAVPGALPDKGTDSSLSGTAGAFGDWLAEFCPAR